VEKLIRDFMKEHGVSLKEAVNAAVRAGLGQRRFVQETFSLGRIRNFNWDKARTVAESIEDEEFGRKLSLRK